MPLFDLNFEIRPDPGMLPQQRLKDGAVETQHFHVTTGPHGCAPDGVFDQSDFAEAVPLSKCVQGNLMTIVSRFDDARAARDKHVERVGGITFPNDRTAKCEGVADETVGNQFTHVLRQKSQNRQFFERQLPEIRIVGPDFGV